MAIRAVVTRGYGNGTFNGTITELALRGYSVNLDLSIGGETNIAEYFTTGGTVTIALYNPITGNSIALNNNSCLEIGSTGLFVWDTSEITTQPTSYQEYAWKMTDGTAAEGGVKVLNPINVDEDNFLIQYLIHEEIFN